MINTIRIRKTGILKFLIYFAFVYLIFSSIQKLLSSKERIVFKSQPNFDHIKLRQTKTPANDSADETALSIKSKSLKDLINCQNQNLTAKIYQNEMFWILQNFIRASKNFKCHESITYVTHSDFTYLDNVIPLLKRWKAPLSLAIYAPHGDFDYTLNAIYYLRNCFKESSLVVELATFHIFFELGSVLVTKDIPNKYSELEKASNCSMTQKYFYHPRNLTFKNLQFYNYPINVARNVARNSSTTHFVLVSDIELYPNPTFVEDFLEMIANHPKRDKLLNEKNIFAIPVFEIAENTTLPNTKSDLKVLFKQEKIFWFHYEICPTCHEIPQYTKWLHDSDEKMKILTSIKRTGSFNHWEPIFVGTKAEPLYDERLYWEGKSDKMTQAYIMCLQNYRFNVLSNAFLIHRNGVKTIVDAKREKFEEINKKLILDEILPEITLSYGKNKGCKMYS